MRNLQTKVPEHPWPEVRARARAAYEAPSLQMAAALRDDFVAQCERESESWRGIAVTAFERKQCEAIRAEIDTEHEPASRQARHLIIRYRVTSTRRAHLAG